MSPRKKISIIGGGVAAMMLAAELDNELFDINIYEKGSSIGKKFLVAGKGGFNLTHSEPLDSFITKYVPSSFIKPYLEKFSNADLRNWLKQIGIQTIIGSSKKIYPTKGITPNQVLIAIKNKLNKNNVKIHLNHEFTDISKDKFPVFKTKDKTKSIPSDIVIFALGGASWKVTGSDGKWLNILKKSDVEVMKFEPSNCAFKVDWPVDFITANEGKPLKNIATKTDNKYIKGELVITNFGLEGGAIYAMSSELRKGLNMEGKTKILIDLKPQFTIEEVEQKLKYSSSYISTSKVLKEYLKLDKAKINLLKSLTTKEEFNDLKILSYKIKNLSLNIVGIASIDEAISTVGGIRLKAIDNNMKITTMPFHYAVGEMLDWDAPTGGYLLQASFSMGYYLAHHLNESYK